MSFQVGIGSLGGTVFFQVGLCTLVWAMPVSIADMAAKTAKECLQHLNVPYAKCHCLSHVQQRIVSTVT